MSGTNTVEWMVIVNPNAGSGKGKRDWGTISALLTKYGISYESVFTDCPKHAIQLTHDCILQGFRNFIVVGGDGTLNEVVNGVFRQTACPSLEIVLAMIAVGTGNDWGKMFGIPHSYEESIKIIRNRKIRPQDVGIVEYVNGNKLEKRHFLNIAGMGFDALVVQRTNLQKEAGRNGKAIYLINLLRSLMIYKPSHIEIKMDGQKISKDFFTISVGIGRYSGGGMLQTPNAIPDDGLFDITVIKTIGKGDIILSLKKLYDGSILKHRRIEGYKAKEILIESNPSIYVEADGETLGNSPSCFRILPKSVGIVYERFPE
jgi:YegS/Rv2252/BmrU family lipid kinase